MPRGINHVLPLCEADLLIPIGMGRKTVALIKKVLEQNGLFLSEETSTWTRDAKGYWVKRRRRDNGAN